MFKFIYNAIPKQTKTYANELTVSEWNNIINILATQSNKNTTNAEVLCKWLGVEESLPNLNGNTFLQYVTNLASQVSTNVSNISNHTTRLDNHDTSITTINDTLGAHRDDIAINAGNISSNQQAIGELDSARIQHRTELDDHWGKITQHGDQIGTIQDDITELQNKDKTLDGYIKANSDRLENHTGRIADAETDISKNAVGIQSNAEDISVLKNRVKALEDNIDDETGTPEGVVKSLFKGSYISLTALTTAHPTAEDGSYAYVNTTVEDGDTLLLYIWDTDANAWKETQSTKYATKELVESLRTDLNAHKEAYTKHVYDLSSGDFVPAKASRAEYYTDNVGNTKSIQETFANTQLLIDSLETGVSEAKTGLAKKQDALTAGEGISIVDGVISISYPNWDEEEF